VQYMVCAWKPVAKMCAVHFKKNTLDPYLWEEIFAIDEGTRMKKFLCIVFLSAFSHCYAGDITSLLCHPHTTQNLEKLIKKDGRKIIFDSRNVTLCHNECCRNLLRSFFEKHTFNDIHAHLNDEFMLVAFWALNPGKE
jgi:hypothetical protein